MVTVNIAMIENFKNPWEFRGRGDSGLKKLVPALFGVELPTFEDVTGGKFFDELLSDDLETIRYACADSDYAKRGKSRKMSEIYGFSGLEKAGTGRKKREKTGSNRKNGAIPGTGRKSRPESEFGPKRPRANEVTVCPVGSSPSGERKLSLLARKGAQAPPQGACTTIERMARSGIPPALHGNCYPNRRFGQFLSFDSREA